MAVTQEESFDPLRQGKPIENITPREEFLGRVNRIVMKDRNETYGDPHDDHSRTAKLLNALGFGRNGQPVTTSDVCVMQVCVRLSRLTQSPSHMDAWDDIAGWAANGWECQKIDDDRRMDLQRMRERIHRMVEQVEVRDGSFQPELSDTPQDYD